MRLEIIIDADHEVKPCVVMNLLAKPLITLLEVILNIKYIATSYFSIKQCCFSKGISF